MKHLGFSHMVRLGIISLGLLAAAPALAQNAGAPAYPTVRLWSGDAPGPKGDAGPEAVRLSGQGDHVISHVRQPTITPFLPTPGTETGAAIIIAPGGGHREIWIDHEGYNVARWLSQHGIAAFVLKYRLSKEDKSPYSKDDSLADAHRAIRLVRSHAVEWHVAPDRVGIMGFSAGGELAALAGWRAPAPAAADAIDQQSARPAFIGLIYPAHSDQTAFSADMPPAFLLAGEQDRPDISQGVPELYLSLRKAGASAELHMLAGVGHGFGMRDSNPAAVAVWPALFYNWLDAKGMLKPIQVKSGPVKP